MRSHDLLSVGHEMCSLLFCLDYCSCLVVVMAAWREQCPLSGRKQEIPVTAEVFEAECLISGRFFSEQ